MTRIVRIFTDLVLVPLTRRFFIALGERDQHQKICVNLSHPCAIIRLVRNITASVGCAWCPLDSGR